MIYIRKEIFKSLLTYVGLSLPVVGMLKLSVYYLAFNIKISSFLEFGEIVTLFYTDVILVFIHLFVALYLVYVIFPNKRAHVQKIRDIAYYKEKNLLKRFLIRRDLTIIFLIQLIALLAINYFIEDNGEAFVLSGTIGVLIGLQFYIILLLEYKRRFFLINNSEFDYSLSNIILLIGVALASISIICVIDIASVKYSSNKGRNYSFEIDGKTVTADKDGVLIGMTQKYIFLYNRFESKSLIYKKDEVKNLQFGGR